jgi:GxxExxY protein
MDAKHVDVLAELTHAIVGSAITVHRELGPGLLEGTYRTCLLGQLAADGLSARHEVPIPLQYKGMNLNFAYRADVIVEDLVLIELKALEALLPIHEAQILTYLKHSNLRVGLLMNFNTTRLVNGIRRFAR